MKRKSLLLFNLAVFFIPTFIFSQTGDAIVAGKEVAIVQTDAGKVRGYIHKGIFTYKGIPYAKAERFMAPAKPAAWKDVRSSMTYGPVCPMDPTTTVNDEFEFPFHHNWGYTNENCQTLNVWTPGINDNKKRPVMVWFHGGGFTAGSYVELPSYDGENISQKGDVVLVSVNHRLNVLGFLDLSAYGDKYKSSSNAGLLDLVAALQWISHANLKAVPGAAPVYMYLFSWQSPVMDGMYKAMHCMELPFVFDNIDKCEEMTGGGKEAYALADKMSSAWIDFARTGNPNAKKLPTWPAYTQQNGATMIFDNKCEVKNNPDKDLLSIAAGAKAF